MEKAGRELYGEVSLSRELVTDNFRICTHHQFGIASIYLYYSLLLSGWQVLLLNNMH
jgi:hypothetical protein